MLKSAAILASVLLGWLAWSASAAWAEDINWSFNWSGTGKVFNDQGGGVQFTPSSGSGTNDGNGMSAVMLQAFGPTGTVTDGAYTLTMHLTDKASGSAGDLTFSGVLSGTTDQGLLNQFNSPLARQVTLGGNNYGVIIGLFAAPGATGSGVQGMIGANVTVVPGQGGPPPVTQVPEPATLTLGLLALLAAVPSFVWRRGAARSCPSPATLYPT